MTSPTDGRRVASGWIDGHVHFWDTDLHTYDWLEDDSGFERRYALGDYRAATADDPPDGFVFVQAGASDADGADEARWVDTMCAGEADFLGMVVWAPVERGAAAVLEHLDRLGLASVVGVRRLIQSEPPGWCTQPGFVAAVAALARRDLAFDVCIRPHHLEDVLLLARGAPETRLVLDHFGKPDIAGGARDAWCAGFAALARCENVWCKLSGLVSEADPDRWSVADLQPYVDVALEAFGPQRMLWGSDWPVVNGAASHRRWRAATDALLAGLGEAERGSIAAETARRVYLRSGA